MKKTLSITLFITLGVILLTACSPNVTLKQPDQRQISVSGRGEVTVKPDVAYVTIGVRSKAAKVSDALKENTAQADAIIKALKDSGIEDLSIRTTTFSVNPSQRLSAEGEVLETYFIVENSMHVTIKNIDKVGEILDAAVSAGANTVENITFDILDKKKATTEARQIAVENAKKEAEELSTLTGIKVGKLINASFYSSDGGARMSNLKLSDVSGQSAVPISSGQLTLAVECSLTYDIE